MLTPDEINAAARTAAIDQFRAHAEDTLNLAIADYRRHVADAGPDTPFRVFVSSLMHLIDGDDHLDRETSDQVLAVVEALGCAIARLAKEDA